LSEVHQTSNADEQVIASFGDEWSRFDQRAMSEAELQQTFNGYFGIFPWEDLPEHAAGFDMGCGSGRWAKLVAPRVGTLTLIDASSDALAVAKTTLAEQGNVRFVEARVDTAPLAKASQDFGYSLGVLHHLPDTAQAIRSCAEYLKPGAPFLVYLYYRFDNRPWWFRGLWQASEVVRGVVSRLPGALKAMVDRCAGCCRLLATGPVCTSG
jgi:SAM-dependent methyltransferase